MSPFVFHYPSLWSLRKFFSVISVSLTSLASGRDKRNLLPISALSHFRQESQACFRLLKIYLCTLDYKMVIYTTYSCGVGG